MKQSPKKSTSSPQRPSSRTSSPTPSTSSRTPPRPKAAGGKGPSLRSQATTKAAAAAAAAPPSVIPLENIFKLQGETALRDAEDADGNGEIDKALRLYTTAASLLVKALKYEFRKEHKDAIHQRVAAAVERVEELKILASPSTPRAFRMLSPAPALEAEAGAEAGAAPASASPTMSALSSPTILAPPLPAPAPAPAPAPVGRGFSTGNLQIETYDDEDDDDGDVSVPFSPLSPSLNKLDAPPREVFCNYTINAVADVNSVRSTFVIDVKLFYSWLEPQCVGRPKESPVNLQEEGLFDPDIVVTNDHELAMVGGRARTVVSDPRTGQVKATVHLKGSAYNNTGMHLDLFPFDCQELPLCLKPYRLACTELVLLPGDTGHNGMHTDETISSEWTVLSHHVICGRTRPEESSQRKVYSSVKIEVLLKRKGAWYINNVILPLLALLLLSLTTYLFPPLETAARNELSLACLMASVSVKYIVADNIPKASYRTLLCSFIDACFYVQVFVVATHQGLLLLSSFASVAAKDGSSLAWANRACCSAASLLALGSMAFLCVKSTLHEQDAEEWIHSQRHLLHANSKLYRSSSTVQQRVRAVSNTQQGQQEQGQGQWDELGRPKRPRRSDEQPLRWSRPAPPANPSLGLLRALFWQESSRAVKNRQLRHAIGAKSPRLPAPPS